MLIVAALLIAGGQARAFAAPVLSQAEPCAIHHHHDQDHHRHAECCCSCLNCPASLITPFEGSPVRPAAFAGRLTPIRSAPLATRSSRPELDPPRPSALS